MMRALSIQEAAMLAGIPTMSTAPRYGHPDIRTRHTIDETTLGEVAVMTGFHGIQIGNPDDSRAISDFECELLIEVLQRALVRRREIGS